MQITHHGAIALIRRTGGGLTILFEKSEIQFRDLQQLAPEAATLKGFGLSEAEQAAAFSTLVDVMGPEKGATGLRNFVTRTATAAKSKERVGALKELGLDPTQVDMAIGGDKFLPTLSLMSQKLRALPQEQRNKLLAKVYGDEAQAAAGVLLDPEKMAQITGRVKDYEDTGTRGRRIKSFARRRWRDGRRRGTADLIAENQRELRELAELLGDSPGATVLEADESLLARACVFHALAVVGEAAMERDLQLRLADEIRVTPVSSGSKPIPTL